MSWIDDEFEAYARHRRRTEGLERGAGRRNPFLERKLDLQWLELRQMFENLREQFNARAGREVIRSIPAAPTQIRLWREDSVTLNCDYAPASRRLTCIPQYADAYVYEQWVFTARRKTTVAWVTLDDLHAEPQPAEKITKLIMSNFIRREAIC